MNELSISATCSFWLTYCNHHEHLADYNAASYGRDGEIQKLVLQTEPLLTREENLLYKDHLILWGLIDKKPA
ncbi:hypothetical protein BT93_G2406 [Corymbia citriodora subsp. variegata]|nr:hypothetical protein BT93_G2406 [Corymbia citriodora subsp. variegata]